MSLVNHKVILGVTGGIAAYKSAELCRLLVKAGANVRVVMTKGACEFIKPLTFQALSGNAVSTELLDEAAEAGMGHIELAKWADLILIAPASANTLARIAHGFADDLLTTLILATTAKLAVAPAMNQAMWSNAQTQANIEQLKSIYGGRLAILGPDSGAQACGDVGPGRMLEPADILSLISAERQPLHCRVVITAGPTQEAIDPVRYITNHSSGKMGFALAEAFRQLGAEVTLIAGPVALVAHETIQRVDVKSAQEMYEQAMLAQQRGFDIFIGSAAVADYRPVELADQKLKKSNSNLTIELTENPDIIASIAAADNKGRLIVGFAAETNDVIKYATSKLERKQLDLVIANDVSDQTIGFNSDENQVALVTADGVENLPKASKKHLAVLLSEKLYKLLETKRNKK